MKESVYTLSFFLEYNESMKRGVIMGFTDWIYAVIIVYLLIMGLLGINLKVIWITLTLKVKVYDFEYLYGRTFGRILFIILALLLYLFQFVIMNSITSISLNSIYSI